ncbi:chorismate mutase [Candidatus Pacearchaeota archaeon]|nr:chorismate mutase [Candidatus Pacearchaeota archaeon]
MKSPEGTEEKIPNLDELREKIDSLDKKLLSVLAERMALIPQVAQYKKIKNIPRFQPDREKMVIESRRAIAEELSVSPDLAEKIMKLIIEDAHRIEKGVIGE